MKKAMTLHQVINELIEALEFVCRDREFEHNANPDEFGCHEEYLSYLSYSKPHVHSEYTQYAIGIIENENVKRWINDDSFAAWKLSELKENLDCFVMSIIDHHDERDPMDVLNENLCRNCIRWLKFRFSEKGEAIGDKFGLSPKGLLLFELLDKSEWVSFTAILHSPNIVDSPNRDPEAVSAAINRLKGKLFGSDYKISTRSENGERQVKMRIKKPVEKTFNTKKRK